MKTYEKFIASNLFRKRKQLPNEVKNFGDVLCLFLNNHIDPEWSAFIREHQPEDKKKDNVIYISIDPDDLGSTPNFINLYYNSKVEKLLIAILTQPDSKELMDIQNFLEYIINDYDVEDMTHSHRYDVSFIIKLDSIPEICQKLNSEEFDFYMNANKYNL